MNNKIKMIFLIVIILLIYIFYYIDESIVGLDYKFEDLNTKIIEYKENTNKIKEEANVLNELEIELENLKNKNKEIQEKDNEDYIAIKELEKEWGLNLPNSLIYLQEIANETVEIEVEYNLRNFKSTDGLEDYYFEKVVFPIKVTGKYDEIRSFISKIDENKNYKVENLELIAEENLYKGSFLFEKYFINWESE